jgi:predicted dienelactone hydrolase
MTYSVGLQTAQVPDPEGGSAIPILLLYPCEAPECDLQFGPYAIAAARDAQVAAGRFPLVLISHGTGSSQFVFRTLARHLARHGWVVAIPEHPHNNRNDDTLAHTAANLVNRPRHLLRVADWMFDASPVARALLPARYAVIGHSLGAYTALALAGGEPTSVANNEPDGIERALAVAHDARVRALVLLAPATPWFRMPGSLAAVTAPTLLLGAERDADAVFSFHGNIVINGLPKSTPLEYHLIDDANHFSFQSVFPESMRRPGFRPAEDEPGFDRARYLEQMNAQILQFLNAHALTMQL